MKNKVQSYIKRVIYKYWSYVCWEAIEDNLKIKVIVYADDIELYRSDNCYHVPQIGSTIAFMNVGFKYYAEVVQVIDPMTNFVQVHVKDLRKVADYNVKK